MWLSPYFDNPWVQDLVATAASFLFATLWLLANEATAHRGWVPSRLSRKIVHIGTGPIFLLTWNLFSEGPYAPFLAALVPLTLTSRFVSIGLGWVEDPSVVASLTRTGDRREILLGPTYYGIVFVLTTILFWRHSPIGMLALMLMCGGDGLADLVGRRWGRVRLPVNPDKSWAGSAAMLVGSFTFAFGYLALFNAFGNFQPQLDLARAAWATAAISLAATAVEALPLPHVDNLTTTATAIALGLLLF